MIKRFFAVLICSIAVLLPWKLRCLFAETLGWIAQVFYVSYAKMFKFLAAQLQNEKGKKNNEK